MDLKQLIEKYSIAGPRYTSYPTAPQWSETLKADAYRKQLQTHVSSESKPLALYVHIPFCESLCYYCGCNIKITKDHARSARYVDNLLRELGTVAKLVGEGKSLKQISWGGGTPTFLRVDEIERLFKGTRQHFGVTPDAEISIEIDPRVTSEEQLECLRSLGFNRVSLGVQDFDPKVQEAINRLQSREMTQGTLQKARSLGFQGINFDLIYGLPFQSLQSFEATVKAVVEIRPDRIALYNYAHIPAMLKHQKIIEKFPMPRPEERVDIFTMAFDYLTRHGYQAIGMDHFALEEDELYKAISTGSLYRNFMGYSVKRGADLIGVGASAIGEVGPGFFQNVREAGAYESAVGADGLATFRGLLLSDEDRRRKWVIQNLMCKFELSSAKYAQEFKESLEEHFATELSQLSGFFTDGILEKKGDSIRVTPLGRLFVRNVAMVFDEYLKTPQKTQKMPTYSKTV